MVTDERAERAAGVVDAVDTTGSFDDWCVDAHPKVVAAVALWSGALDVAADATDEAFVRALGRWQRQPPLVAPTAWVTTVAFNLVRRHMRRAAVERRLLRRLTPAAALPGPAGEVFALIAELPPQQRRIVLLRHVVDLTQDEIADALGIKRSTVSSTLTDAHRRLRSLLEDATTAGGGEHAQ